MAIVPARAEDLAEVLALLAAAGLPAAGVADHFPRRFLVARDPADGALAGTAGVEAHGRAGLLRSVAVRADRRGTGLGQELVRASAALAREEGLAELYLLTTTAEGFFPRLGFEPIAREELPPELEGSEELRGACPASAAAMRLRL
ncbi:MAG TPA: arsenic resistance N-acetyltransferase ArsN2 [Longimicrobiaceae bacterium]|nr:arsenic resistance N-acetyltransferase ArsN2 [Longimicrobiaceae bacterium]